MVRVFEAARDREKSLRLLLKFKPSGIAYVSIRKTYRVPRPSKLEVLQLVWAFRTASRLFDENGVFVGATKKDGA